MVGVLSDCDSLEVPLLSPNSADIINQAYEDVFTGFDEEQTRHNIPKDPCLWSPLEVSHWLNWCQSKFRLDCLSPGLFAVGGAELCALGHQRFMDLIPDYTAREILWEHLEIMKRECSVDHNTSSFETLHQPYLSTYSVSQPVNVSCALEAGSMGYDITELFPPPSLFGQLQEDSVRQGEGPHRGPEFLPHPHETFKEFVEDRSDLPAAGRPEIPAAILADYTGKTSVQYSLMKALEPKRWSA
ncbi:UNVERIFIED_CONTAM: hypothetical protein FKN15_022124 [Acipenser sinensis]